MDLEMKLDADILSIALQHLNAYQYQLGYGLVSRNVERCGGVHATGILMVHSEQYLTD